MGGGIGEEESAISLDGGGNSENPELAQEDLLGASMDMEIYNQSEVL